MSEHLYIAAPLDVDGWEVIECLESHTLFGEFAERVDDALSLLREGQSHWREHQTADGEWSATAVDTVGEVRRRAYNIRQSFQRYGDLAACIRSSIGNSGELGISDAQYVAALAMDRACWVIESLASWLSDFDGALYSVRPDLVELIAENDPDGFADLLARRRAECAQGEIDTRECVADYFGEARRYMSQADEIAQKAEAEHLSKIARNDLSRLQADLEERATAAKARVTERARELGKSSAEVRKNNVAERNGKICKAALRGIRARRTRTEVESDIHASELAEKIPGSADDRKITKKTIQNILKAGGIKPWAK